MSPCLDVSLLQNQIYYIEKCRTMPRVYFTLITHRPVILFLVIELVNFCYLSGNQPNRVRKHQIWTCCLYFLTFDPVYGWVGIMWACNFWMNIMKWNVVEFVLPTSRPINTNRTWNVWNQFSLGEIKKKNQLPFLLILVGHEY